MVIASKDYPENVKKGLLIEGIEDAIKLGLLTFHGGTVSKNEGCVLTVLALNSSLLEAVELAQKGAALIKFEGSFFRKYIGHRAVTKIEVEFFFIYFQYKFKKSLSI